MESFISAILGELTTRSINFFISKLSKPTPLDVKDRLSRVLLRAQVIIDEAKGRHITNHAMLLQLVMLRNTMHRSHYVLDTFIDQHHHDEDANNLGVGCSSSLSKVNSAMRLSSRGSQSFKDLQEALDNLSSMILDVSELILFLTSYPRLNCQPYSMHLVLGNCMFGRQMEAETVINFLLQTQPYGAEEPEVLPIVGPIHVGKSTLVAHVCKDERVLDHFVEIIFLHDHWFTDDELTTFRETCARKYQNFASDSNKVGRLLVVLELVGDLNEDAWNKLHSVFKQCIPSGSKIIVTSRSDKIVKFGTKQALTLKHLSHEAFWYFFKTLTFGNMDPETHPRFVRQAMEIAKMLDCYFIGAHITSSLLRDNFDIEFWCKIVAFLRAFFQKHVSRFGEHPFDLLNQNRPTHFGRMAMPSEVFVIYHQYQCSGQEEVPKIRFEDVMYGTFKTSGKFDLLSWRSSIPPYYSFVSTCEILDLKSAGIKRKRSLKDGDTSLIFHDQAYVVG